MIRPALLFPLLALAPALAPATPRTSASYLLSPEGLVPGGPAASSQFTLTTGLDPSAGPVAASASFSLKTGYVGQLYEVSTLSVTAAQPSVNEGATNQLAVSAVLDDATTLALASDVVSWSVVSGPVSAVDAAGLAQTAATFADLPATVRASFLTTTGDATFTVVNLSLDDVPPVAGDGIDDAWQFANFDANHDGTLDAGEAADAGPDANPDRDPNRNDVEWLTGFDPNDSTAFFNWTVADRIGTTVDVRANRVVPGTIFRLQTTLDLANGPWTTVDTVTPAAETTNQPFADPNATGAARYYRLELEKAP